MKVFKELPKSIYYSLFLRIKSFKSLTRDKKQLPVIVSITSIPSRLSTIDITIKSLLNQNKVVPEKIILWLHKSLKDNIPIRLQKLEGVFFEICYSELKCSHRKLIHTLKDYDNKTIITCDDDVIYRADFLQKIYNEHLLDPDCIIANRTVQIKFDDKGRYKPYSDWKFKEHNYSEKSLLPIGVCGVLYPPNSMPDEVFNIELFLKLTPKADDLWFKGMALINNVISRQAFNTPKEPIPIIGSQKESLKKVNVKMNKNEIQWKALSKHFNLKEILLGD
jgi:hypothetical protein